MFNLKKFNILILTLIFLLNAHFSYSQDSLDVALDNLTKQINRYMGEQKKTKIAIIPFSDLQKQITTVLGSYIAEELTTNLFMTGKFKIVERNLLKQILDELKLSQTGVVDSSSAKELGKMTGVDAIVVGTITDLGSYLAINCRLIETESGEIFAVAKAKIKKDENITKIMNQMIETAMPKSTSSTKIKQDVKLKPMDNTLKFQDRIVYLKPLGKRVKIKLSSIKKLEDGEIECSLLLTNLDEVQLTPLINRSEEATYISDNSGIKYFCQKVKGIPPTGRSSWSTKFLYLQPNIPVRISITFPKPKEATTINLIVQFYFVGGGYGRDGIVNAIFYNIDLR